MNIERSALQQCKNYGLKTLNKIKARMKISIKSVQIILKYFNLGGVDMANLELLDSGSVSTLSLNVKQCRWSRGGGNISFQKMVFLKTKSIIQVSIIGHQNLHQHK